MARGRQERQAARMTWEGIQRIELCDSASAAFEIVETTARQLGCDLLQVCCTRADSPLRLTAREEVQDLAGSASSVSGPAAIFRLSGGDGLWIAIRVELKREPELAPDIVFRYLERLGQALAGRLEWFQSIDSSMSESWIPAQNGAFKPDIAKPSPSQGGLRGAGGAISRILGLRYHPPTADGGVPSPRLPVGKSVTAPTGLARR
jgi:UDP-GlcNAc:undecaprenyl-phosphate GlcNAc-1-phosphate transferase